MPKLTVYGAPWCADTRMAKRVLDNVGVAYDWVDVDEDTEGEAYVKEVSNGMRVIPVLVFDDGDMLVEPSRSELTEKLDARSDGSTSS